MIGKKSGHLVSIVIAIALLVMWRPVLAQSNPVVSVQLSSPSIAFEESVTLEVVARGVSGELDTSALLQDFDITGRSQSQQIRIVNGANDALLQWTLQLTPRRTGTLTVPAVSVGGVSSNPLTLVVGDAPTGADRVLFLELDIDASEPWVQQQIYLTLSIYHRIPLDRYQVSTPELPGVSVLPIDGEVTRTVQRDSVSYNVLEKRFAVFPQQSGSLSIPPLVLTALVPANPARPRTFMSPTRRVTRRTDSITLEVKPRPSDVTTPWWLPSRSLEISDEWIDGTTDARVGEPLSRRLTIRAEGVLPTQLPTSDAPTVDGASIYVDEPVDTTVAEIDGLVTERVINWAVIAERAGPLVIPAVEIEWFDSVAGVSRTARIPEQTIEVQAAATANANSPAADVGASGTSGDTADGVAESLSSGSAAASAATDAPEADTLSTAAIEDPSSAIWRLIAGFAFFGWAVTGAVFLWRELARRGVRKSRSPSPRKTRVADTLRLLDEAARYDDHDAAARAVRSLAKAHAEMGKAQTHAVAPGLAAIAADARHAGVADELRALDARLYGGGQAGIPTSEVDLHRLHQHFSTLDASSSGRPAVALGAELPSL